jgi:hypothetical protein
MPGMDELKLQPREIPAIRSFRICVDRPQRPTTILDAVRRHAESATPRRPVVLRRPTSVFA